MIETVTGEGEVLSLAEVAGKIPPPPHWRRAEGISEGEIGAEYEAAWLEAQKEIGPLVEAEADNPFNKSRYASLAQLLLKIAPVANKHGLTIKQGCGRIGSHGSSEAAKRQLFLPIFTTIRHVKTGQWERFLMEIPLIKIDAQSLGSALTYGRRYVLQAAWAIASTDDDGVLASLKPRLDANPADEAASGMIEKINECKTAEELKIWHDRNRQGFDLLGEETLDALREAYKKRLKEVEEAVAQAGKYQIVDAGPPAKAAKGK
jgi:hypothetical protein